MAAGMAKTGRRAPVPVVRIFRLANYLNEVIAHAGMALILCLMILQIVEIIGRRTLNFSILGLSEIGQLLVMSCISFVLPFAFIRENHIAVEFITNGLPGRSLAFLNAAVALISAIFVMTLAYFGFRQGWAEVARGDISPTLGIPIAWYWVPVIIGISVSGLTCLLLAVVHFCEAIYEIDVRANP